MLIAPKNKVHSSTSANASRSNTTFIQPKAKNKPQTEKEGNETLQKNGEFSIPFFSPKPKVKQKQEEETQSKEAETTEIKTEVSEQVNSELNNKKLSSDKISNETANKGKQNKVAKKPEVVTNNNTGGGNPKGEEKNNEAEQEIIELPTENTKVYSDTLVAQSPISFMKSVKTSEADSLKAKIGEQNALQESLPEIEQPTGIPRKAKANTEKVKQKTNQEANNLKGVKIALKDIAPKGKKEGTKVEEKNVQPPSTVLQKLKSFFGLGKSGSDDDKKSNIKSGIKNLPTSESVDTNLGETPKVDLTGQADPSKNEENTQAAEVSVAKDQTKNIEESKIYRGEDDIYPEMEIEMLNSTTEISVLEANTELKKEIPNVSTEVAQNFDVGAKAHMDQEVAIEKAKQDEAYTKMEADQEQERATSELAIEAETNRVKKEQESEQLKAKTDVDKQRSDWQKENQSIKDEYGTKSKKERDKVDKGIDTKTKETDKQVDQEYKKAKIEGDKKVNTVNKEAQVKKAQAKKDSEKKSWWDRAVDAVSSFFDKLKEALNTLFDGLRKLVKSLIEAAKKLANKLIDLARDAIIGMIKAFGEALKALVNVALAAFPKLRDKFNLAIDAAVNKATEIVNQLAEGLKKVVNALLDALGAVLDAILEAYQALYNLFLDALKFLTVGLLKVLEFLWNLVEGAGYAPVAFFGALAKEAIGGDPSKPLDNFEVPQGQEDNWSKAMGLQSGKTELKSKNELVKRVPEQLQGILSKDELSDSDVSIEPNPAVELGPELLSQLSTMPDGGIMELEGAGSNAITTREFQASAADASGYDLNSIQETSTEQVQQSIEASKATTEQTTEGVTEDSGRGSGPDWKNMSDDEKLGHYLGQMLQPTKEAGAEKPQSTSQKPQPTVDNSPEVLITKTGRLGVGQRLAFMGEQMMTGIQVMWNKYKAWIIGILIGALIAAGVLAFFTGGAALAAAVGIIVKAMIVIFGAVAVYKAMGHIWDYVKYAWAGDSKKAGESLATALAVIVVEFFLDKILLGMAKVFKRIMKAVKAVIKSTKAGRKLFAGAAKVSRFAKTTIRKGVSKVKGSKLVVNMQGRIGKGVKKFSDLRQKILDKFKFKRIWFVFPPFSWELWGEFNARKKLSRGKRKKKQKGGAVSTGKKTGITSGRSKRIRLNKFFNEIDSRPSKVFENRDNRLPKHRNGQRLTYKEYDYDPSLAVKGHNRGKLRIVVGSDGSAYFTNTHYTTFQRIK